MASLARSSSVFPAAALYPTPLPYPVALAHSMNDSGRMGLFVKPSCACSGCGGDSASASAAASASVPALGPTESVSMPSLALQSRPAGLGGLGWGLTPLRPLAPAPAPAAAPAAVEEPEDLSLDEVTANTLRGLRASLQNRQDAVYSGEAHAHDEMAAQDAEFEELDRQIQAIETLLISFRCFFRTR